MKEIILTHEIRQAISEAVNSLLLRYGLIGLVTVGLVALLLYYLIQRRITRSEDSFKNELQKNTEKHLTVWKSQKDLTFEFVDFLEQKLFNNPNLEKQKEEILRELNRYYGKLYLVLDTEIIENINKLTSGSVSKVQRYYYYREMRRQLIQNIHSKLKDEDFPYVSLAVDKTPVVQESGERPSSFEDLKKYYPFIENGESKNTYKGLPFFGENEGQKK